MLEFKRVDFRTKRTIINNFFKILISVGVLGSSQNKIRYSRFSFTEDFALMAVNIYVHWKIPVNTECGGGERISMRNELELNCLLKETSHSFYVHLWRYIKQSFHKDIQNNFFSTVQGHLMQVRVFSSRVFCTLEF